MPRDSTPTTRHAYDLFISACQVGRLAWRSEARAETGWYLELFPEPPERLAVDPVIDELARDRSADPHTWEVNAALAATLSAPLALDAAERCVNRRPARATGRFRRLTERARVEIYVVGLEPRALHFAVPELALEAVSEVSVLAGTVLPETREAVTRRILLLGGQIVAIFGDDAEPGAT